MSDCRAMARALAEGAGLGGRPFSADESGISPRAPRAGRPWRLPIRPPCFRRSRSSARTTPSGWGSRRGARGDPRGIPRPLRPAGPAGAPAPGAARRGRGPDRHRHAGGARRRDPRPVPGGGIARAGGAHARPDAPLGAIDWVAGAARAVLGEEGPGREERRRRRAGRGRRARAGLGRSAPARAGRRAARPVETVSSPTAHIISLSIEPEGGTLAAEPRAGARQAAGAAVLPAASDVVLIVDREMDI